MKRVLKTGLLASTIIAFTAPVVLAADIDSPVPQVQVDDNYVSGWYVRGDAGFSWLDISGLDNGGAAVVGGGVGYQINEYFRTDVRADYAFDHDAGVFDVRATTILWNGYIDVPLSMGFTPYVGLGAGYGFVDYSGAGSPSDDDGFAWAATGGVAFNLSQNIALDAAYQYREIDVSGPNYRDHSITGGLRWSF
ncbi:MAG: porin family protein [Anderseniella sp.]